MIDKFVQLVSLNIAFKLSLFRDLSKLWEVGIGRLSHLWELHREVVENPSFVSLAQGVLDVIDSGLEGVNSAIENSGYALTLLDLRVHKRISPHHHLSLLLLKPLSNVFESICHLLFDGRCLIGNVPLPGL